jgi:predicted O-methyltransferase YrrM
MLADANFTPVFSTCLYYLIFRKNKKYTEAVAKISEVLMKYLSIILVTGCLLTRLTEAEIPEPYKSTRDLPFDPHGWFPNARQLAACFQEKPIAVVIEVGAWLGVSTRFLASSVQPGGKVYAVDTWSPTEEVYMTDPRLPCLYQLFLSNVKHAQLTDTIVPVRMTSLEAAQALNVKADLIYIDAAHDTVSVREDILAWAPHLEEGGILCGDDWPYPPVQAAVKEAAKKLDRSIYSSERFWRIY